MYIMKKLDGSLQMVEDLDEKSPDQDLLKDVEEVYPITKVWVPQLKLVPKTKEERKQIKEELEERQKDAAELQGNTNADSENPGPVKGKGKTKQG